MNGETPPFSLLFPGGVQGYGAHQVDGQLRGRWSPPCSGARSGFPKGRSRTRRPPQSGWPARRELAVPDGSDSTVVGEGLCTWGRHRDRGHRDRRGVVGMTEQVRAGPGPGFRRTRVAPNIDLSEPESRESPSSCLPFVYESAGLFNVALTGHAVSAPVTALTERGPGLEILTTGRLSGRSRELMTCVNRKKKKRK